MSSIAAPRTARYARRREEILRVASRHINVLGTRGMTLTAVARELGLDTSSVTYYFKRKDQLAAACLGRTLEWQLAAAQRAALAADPHARVRAFLAEHFALHRAQRDPATAPLALLSDLAALEGEARAQLDAQLDQIVDTVRGYFDQGDEPGARSRNLIAVAVLLSTVYWMPAWIGRYLLSDFDRIEARLFDLLANGLAGPHPWPVAFDPLEEPDDGNPALTRFLHAATNLINSHGYIGASVEKIAGELGLSTGSFYHHLDNKDDLVVACFRRTFAMLKRAQQHAVTAGGSQGEQLARMCSSLCALQFAGESPMLRISAFHALPPDLRDEMLERSGRNTRHIAGMISDAIADGSLRPVDATLASHAVMGTLNSAADLRAWASRRPLDQAVAQFAHVFSHGIF